MSSNPSGAGEDPIKTGELPSAVKRNLTHNTAYIESAALLIVWSVCVTIEGGLRFNDVNPSENFNVDRFPSGLNKIALFIGGLAEVIFGLMGLCLGLSALIFRWFDQKVVKLALLVQFILGVYVFTTFVIVFPIYRSVIDGTPGIGKWMITLGLLTSVNFCYALQGGQFLFMARLISTATGEDFLKGNSGHKMRAIFWLGNMALAGLWTFAFGITATTDRAKAVIPNLNPMGGFWYVFPPHVGDSAGFSLAAGLIMLIWALVGISLAMKPTSNISWYYLGSIVVFLLSYLNFTIAQVGLFPGGSNAIAMHTGLILFVSLLGPYFLHKSTQTEDV